MATNGKRTIMITLLSLLSLAQAELLIETNLQEHYISGQPIFVDIRIQNIGDSTETLPNLKKQTSALQWTIENSKGKQKIRSKEAHEQETWRLEPRQLKEIRFLLPNSSELPLGKQKISLQLDLPKPYTETKEIQIHRKEILWDDRENRGDQAFFPSGEYLWGQAFSKKEQMIFLETQNRSIPLFIAPIDQRFQQSISNKDNQIHSVRDDQITLQFLAREEIQKTQKIALPWKKTTIFTRGISDSEQRFHLPIWIPDPAEDDQKTSGMIRSIMISHNGEISYRKIISLPEKPISIDSALTSAGIPLYLIQTSNRLYLFPLTQTGNEKIDLLPPQNITVRSISKEEKIKAHFGIDAETGLIIHILSQKENQLFSEVYSLQGKEQKKQTIPLPETTLNITEVLYHQSQLFLLAKDDASWYQFLGADWTKLEASKYPSGQIFKIEPDRKNPENLSIYMVPKED